MLWILPWSESIKKRACRYLLQRYLGNFLEEKLTLDQLSVDLYNGTGTVCDVSLDCEALNEVGDRQNWPLQIVDGHMSKIALTIPWATLLKDDSIVEVSGLSITVQPKVRAEQVSSMLESMWSSMSSSMQLAEECLRAEDGPSESHPVEGIEMFAQAIDSILCRVKVKFTNTKIRIEHVPKNSDRGIALEIHITKIDYFDEAGTEPTPDTTDPDKPKTYIVSTFTNKKIKFEGVTLYTDEFPAKMRTMSRSLVMEKSVSSQPEKESEIENYQSTMSDVFYETRSIISTIEEPINHVEEEKPPTVFVNESIEEKLVHSEPILFAELTGQQELSLKMKHAEEVEGPKVEINMLFGSLVVFISPRQLHTLIELADALNQPDLEDTSNLPLRPSGVGQCKPMKRADYQLIEAQLLGRLERASNRHAGAYGWSGPSLDDSDTESEKFLPMTSPNQMTESFTSSVSSMSGSMASSVNVPAARPKRNRKVPHIDGDPTAEVSHIYFRMNSLACILLHKNILRSTPIGSDCVSPSSASKMHKVSSEFFNRLEPVCVSDGGKKEFDTANEAINRATNLDHLRLITSELSLDGSEKVTTQGSQTMCEASISRLLLRECLYSQPGSTGPESFDLIRFYAQEKEESSKKPSTSRSNIRMNFKQTSKFVRSAGEQKLVNPTTDVTVRCMPIYVDIELSVIDRMCATFFCSRVPTVATPASNATQNHFNFNMQTSAMNLGLRFPIADLRPTVNREVRNVRPDFLVFKLKNATISCHQVASVHAIPTTLSLKATTLDLYYYENDHLPATHIARSTMDDHAEANILKGSVSASLPTVSLTFQPKKPSSGPFDPFRDDDNVFQSINHNPMTTSIYIMNNVRTTGPSPFSSKRSAYHSFTKHNNNNKNGKGQDEELIVPGNEEEMTEFTNSTVSLSNIHLDFNLPILSLQLESKQLYEIIYNRINSDLLLWEPLTVDPFEISPHTGPINPASFCECKTPGLDSDTETESSEEDNMYYSTYDNKLKKGIGNSRAFEEKDTHNFCLTLKVGKGLLTIYAPVRDSNKRVVPGQMGELVLEAQKLSMCQVSGLNGKPKTAQLCLRAAKTVLYHESLLSIPSEKPCLRTYGPTLPSYLKQTIYPSGKGVQLKERKFVKDMFTLALKAEPDAENTTLKTITVSIGIENASLRHRGDKGLAWLSQVMDVLDVVEYPVAGAHTCTVLSQLHVCVCNTAIDYRPLYLPIRAVVTIGNFNFSSNLIPETNTSCLRFIAQDCLLFLSYIHGTKANTPVPLDEDKTPNLHKDYVCVVDMELFELSLRMEDKSGVTDQPLIDLSASNNMLNLKTCWDSASALCRLLTYAASDGDCQPPIEPSSRHTSICSDQPIDTLVGIDDKSTEEIRELSPSEIQQVNDLMAEAMKESPNTTLDEDELNSSTEKEDVKIYFFPDESNTKTTHRRFSSDSVEMGSAAQPNLSFDEFQFGMPDDFQDLKPNNQVARDLGQCMPKPLLRKSTRVKKKSSSDGNNTDDEFCIIDQVPKRDGDMTKPKQKQLNDGHGEMSIEPPSVKSDVLEAPKYFPAPVLRYKLCEMSINWVLFGGSDFTSPDKVPKKSVTIDVESRRESPVLNKRNKTYEPYDTSRTDTAAYRQSGVTWSVGAERVRPSVPPAPAPAPLKCRGGAARDHTTRVTFCLNKVKFIHEVYPLGCKQASRQTLAIAKIEILDQLKDSELNKLLSLYNMPGEPDRRNSHMLMVKATHQRGDSPQSSQECGLKVSLLPLKFHIDQDTLTFLISFFSKLGSDEFCDDDTKSLSNVSLESSGSKQSTPTHRPPVMSIATHLRDVTPTPPCADNAEAASLADDTGKSEPFMEAYEAERLVSDNLIQLEEDFNKIRIRSDKPTHRPCLDDTTDDSPIYFRHVVFSPNVPIRLDYVGKHVDLTAGRFGPLTALLLGLGQLNCSELTLKRLYLKTGLLGLEKLIQWALHEWLADIKRNQLPGLLSGIGPMHSVLQLITGIRDLIWLPVEQWRRDGRVVLGLRRGAASFTARTAVAAIDLTSRLLHLVQATAETAFDMLTPGPTLPLQDAYERRQRRRRRRRDHSRHPQDIREGVASAYQTVREGFADTAATMVLAARCESGVAVLRQLPGAAVTPLALAAAGAADLLGGVRAAIAPGHTRDHADKWRSHALNDSN